MGAGTMTTLEWVETHWDGEPAGDVPGVRATTTASDRVTVAGYVEGEAVDRWLMSYPGDGTATFIGLTHVTGTVEARSGTFVLQHVGRFDEAGLHTRFTVVPGSGSGELERIGGSGTFEYTGPAGEPTRYEFDAVLP